MRLENQADVEYQECTDAPETAHGWQKPRSI